MPRVIIADALPSFRFLHTDDGFQALSSLSITLVSVQAGHLFLNFSERQIQEFKKLKKSCCEDKHQGVYYNQSIDLLQLSNRLRRVEDLLSLCPILATSSEKKAVFLLHGCWLNHSWITLFWNPNFKMSLMTTLIRHMLMIYYCSSEFCLGL